MSETNNASSGTYTTAAFTVVTPNYIAHALSVKKSFLQQNPEAIFFIGFIGHEIHCPQKEIHNIYFIDSLKDGRIEGMIQRYDPFELSCALKPFFASHIFDQQPSLQRLIYLDGDMYVFGKFLVHTEAAITISPHRTKNINYLPGLDNFSSISLNRYGVFNAGYFELKRKKETFVFLEWWKELMETMAVNKPDEHIFADQLWLNTVPSFFDDVYINKDPGYNVAFWNLIERHVEAKNGSYYVNEKPLVLFHFSNYKIEAPEKLVNFDHPSLSFDSLPVLKPIFQIYRESLLEAGYEKARSISYPFSFQRQSKKKGSWKKLFS